MGNPNTRGNPMQATTGLADAPASTEDQYNAIRARYGQAAADKFRQRMTFLDSNSTTAQQLARGLLPQ